MYSRKKPQVPNFAERWKKADETLLNTVPSSIRVSGKLKITTAIVQDDDDDDNVHECDCRIVARTLADR